jgi:hypothetical protein
MLKEETTDLATKQVVFTEEEHTARIKVQFFNGEEEVSWKYLTAEETYGLEDWLSPKLPKVYEAEELLADTADMGFDTENGEETNFELMLEELVKKA